MKTKLCSCCNTEQPEENFYIRKETGGLHPGCKSCRRKKALASKKSNPDKVALNDRRHYWKKKYGITEADYNAMLVRQNGVCEICKEPESYKQYHLAVDHCHATGKIRGILSRNCNLAVGCLKEQVSRAESLISYLETHNS